MPPRQPTIQEAARAAAAERQANPPAPYVAPPSQLQRTAAHLLGRLLEREVDPASVVTSGSHGGRYGNTYDAVRVVVDDITFSSSFLWGGSDGGYSQPFEWMASIPRRGWLRGPKVVTVRSLADLGEALP